jgi:hypothetical protein
MQIFDMNINKIFHVIWPTGRLNFSTKQFRFYWELCKTHLELKSNKKNYKQNYIDDHEILRFPLAIFVLSSDVICYARISVLFLYRVGILYCMLGFQCYFCIELGCYYFMLGFQYFYAGLECFNYIDDHEILRFPREWYTNMSPV